MVVFLLIISFILHGVLVLSMVILSVRVKKAQELETRQKQVAEDIEQMFTAYLLEIKEENERFQQMLNMEGKTATDYSPSYPERNRVSGAENPVHTYGKQNFEKQLKPVYQPLMPGNEQVNYEPSFSTQVFSLQDQGYSIEEIARQLNRGKTEIALILKFNQQNM
ncbi:DUF6115 domain-containing protein [Thalassobacillus devorans]|uniref:DUF6115 domain-containing protein n=1 Tax=Thalassobacillus devorans TaxID=279813 RepID=UPI00049077AE|nr:hypothetical protein [Thalassobacillus devorans]